MNKASQKIQVFARCRPLNAIEKKQYSPQIVDVISDKKIIVKDKNVEKNREFTFDRVFPPNANQISVYKAVVQPLIQEVLQGYNCTVFAYGQTGTGKTYTMEGERGGVGGLVPRWDGCMSRNGDCVEGWVSVVSHCSGQNFLDSRSDFHLVTGRTLKKK